MVNRCPEHQRGHETTPAERRTFRDLRERWVASNGLVCPGWRRDAHAVSSLADLTVDHVVARVHGGKFGPLAVLCRSCNSSKAAAGGLAIGFA